MARTNQILTMTSATRLPVSADALVHRDLRMSVGVLHCLDQDS